MNHDSKFVVEENDNGVVKLVLDRPPLNIFTIEMLAEFNRVLERLSSDESIRLVIVTGEGKAFSAGVDVGEHLPDKAARMLAAFRRTCELLTRIEAPTLCAINGAALGGGCEVAMLCDIAIACESARLGQPEIKLATLAPVAAAILPRLCGVKKSLELLLTGDSISATEAARIGLISRAVPDEQLQSEIDTMAQKIAALSPQAVRIVKRVVREGLELSVEAAAAGADAVCLDMLLNLDDSQEGLRAFLEKRQPHWATATA